MALKQKSGRDPFEGIRVSNSQAMKILKLCIQAQQTAMLWGAPGIGKTTMIYELAKKLGVELCVLNPSQDDIIDLKLPYVSNGLVKEETVDQIALEDLEMKFSKFAYSERLPHGKKSAMIFVDELPTASVAMQSTLFSLILEGRIGGYRVPPGTLRFAAGNCEFHSSGANPVSLALKDRLMQHMYIIPNEEDFCAYGATHHFAPEILGFVRNFPQHLEGSDPDDPAGGCTPRSLEALSDKIKVGIPSDIASVVYNGTIGAQAGSDFAGFMELAMSEVDIPAIISNPDTAKIPDQPNVIFALISALACKVNKETANSIFRYANRLPPAYMATLVSDVRHRDPKIMLNKEVRSFILKNAKLVGTVS